MAQCANIFKSVRPVGQAVKTPPSHGGDKGSIPLRVTTQKWLKTYGFGSFLLFVPTYKFAV